MAGGAAAQPWYKALPQAALDMDRIVAHGLTFGLNDKVVHALTGADAEGSYQAARDRAGIAGDIASVAGAGGGLKVGLGAAKGALPAIARAVFSKKGALAAGLGLAGLGEYNARTGSADAAAPSVKTPTAAPAAKKGPDLDALAAKLAGAISGRSAAPAAAPTFSDMVQQLAAGQGGSVSLRQLGALSEAAQKGATADYYEAGGAHTTKPGDAAGNMLENMYITQFQKALQDPKADPAKAQDQFESKVLQLRKSQFIDPYGLHDGDQ